LKKFLTDNMATIKIKKIKSEINRPSNQKLTLLALGLKKIGQVVEHQDTPNIVGMVNRVKHLVKIIK
tara:strand:+ start:387 stop:587 length:201 start_codon:yes stop_codon:yes gene_type:complete